MSEVKFSKVEELVGIEVAKGKGKWYLMKLKKKGGVEKKIIFQVVEKFYFEEEESKSLL
jgi:hypothetical protein